MKQAQLVRAPTNIYVEKDVQASNATIARTNITEPTRFKRNVGEGLVTHRKRQPVHSLSLYIGLGIIAVVLLTGVLTLFWTPYPYEQLSVGPPLAAPSFSHYFGTDNLGRDLFSRVLVGARLALIMAIGGVGIGLGIGVTLGIIAGFYGRWVDGLLSRVMDVWLAFPALLLAILVVARFGASLTSTIIALGIVGAPSFYRLVRSGALSSKHELHVEAARSIGVSDFRILSRHIFPFTMSAIIVLASMRCGMLLLAGAGLSFIGLGVQPPTPEWGALLAAGRNYLDTAPWMAIFPGIAITITVVGFNLLGDGLRDALDPHR